MIEKGRGRDRWFERYACTGFGTLRCTDVHVQMLTPRLCVADVVACIAKRRDRFLLATDNRPQASARISKHMCRLVKHAISLERSQWRGHRDEAPGRTRLEQAWSFPVETCSHPWSMRPNHLYIEGYMLYSRACEAFFMLLVTINQYHTFCYHW